MPRLTDFPGFTVSKSKGSFNPFDFGGGVKEEVKTSGNTFEIKVEKSVVQVDPFKGEKNAVEYIPIIEEKEKEKEVFHSSFKEPSELSESPIVPLFPKQEAKQELKTPMIQPRSSEGQRLLYKYPNIHKVAGYYLLVGSSDKSSTAHLVQFDGAANPNPGSASSGAVLWSPKGADGKRSILFESGKYLGKATNNIAEAQGLLLALQVAAMRNVREILIEGDSELIVFQQIGKYKVSDKNLKVWWAQSQAAMMDEACFDWIAIRQVPREQNERADSITKDVLARKQSFQRA